MKKLLLYILITSFMLVGASDEYDAYPKQEGTWNTIETISDRYRDNPYESKTMNYDTSHMYDTDTYDYDIYNYNSASKTDDSE